jgi:hypothetical protein
MIPANERFRVGMVLKALYDDGLKGSILYGRVIEAGPKCFTVEWESGLTNRLRQGDKRVTWVKPGEWYPESLQEQTK